EFRQRLALAHHVEVGVCAQSEGAQGVVQLFTMLSCHQRDDVDLTAGLQRCDDGRHLVGFWPGSERHADPGSRHAAAPRERLTSANRASDTAAMRTMVRTSVASVRMGGVEDSSMPTTLSTSVALHNKITVSRLEPERSRNISCRWSLEASAGLVPRRSRLSDTCVMLRTGSASTSIGATTETAAVTLRAPSTLTAAST